MSPRRFLEGDHKQQVKSGVAINGPRPTPLKLKQESHTIQKQQQQIRKPVIIYTYSPEVIHTKPHDFMALVQKLTGHSGSKDQERRSKTVKKDGYDRKDNEISNDFGVTHEKSTIMKAKSPMFNAPLNPYMADIPLFTPNSSDYFCSPRPLFRFTDMVSSSPNISTSLSPSSLVELMKILPEY
ncbi:VQ motif-containing protein 8, chloroplastic [Lactuca sativa]|uniref:VQ domain-containing protein n=1 Tax=Lactuca saligna TaxID=75948 RepID=A0AA36EHS3_LACSI|nr:VQ motif-containing protein 8, chloroplastic [Lactuca sativa]CAI9296773.1 unnamed protein product [Lactuca saligna]